MKFLAYSKKISIIIPVPPNGNTGKPISSIKEIDFPKDQLEVIVAEGKQPSAQRNRAVEQASGEIIYFVDSDVVLEKFNLEKISQDFKEENVAVAGGPVVLSKEANFLQKCFGIVFSSFFAMGKTNSRFAKIGKKRIASEEELILANLAFRKNVFAELNGFNEKLYPNEENELMNRIQEKGFKMVYDPEIVVSRVHKKNIVQFASAFMAYGRGRAEHFFQNPKFLKPFFLIPSFFVIYLVSLLFFHDFFYLLPLIAYFTLDFAFSVYYSLKNLPGFFQKFFALFFLFPTVHVFYGIGFLYGCTKTALRIAPKKDFNIKIFKVKI